MNFLFVPFKKAVAVNRCHDRFFIFLPLAVPNTIEDFLS